MRNILLGFSAAILVMVSGCGSEEISGALFAPELTYTVVIDAEQGIESSLLIRVKEENPIVQVYGTDGVFRAMPISSAELSVLLDKFLEGAVITDYSDINATSDIGLPGPDCVRDPKICQAIEIAHDHVTGGLDPLDPGPHRGDETKSFIAKDPVNLLPETAELILSLERLRVRVHTEGAVVQ